MSYVPNILRAVEFMERNLTCAISISDVASEAAYSTFHFVRLFRALTGDTTGNYRGPALMPISPKFGGSRRTDRSAPCFRH